MFLDEINNLNYNLDNKINVPKKIITELDKIYKNYKDDKSTINFIKNETIKSEPKDKQPSLSNFNEVNDLLNNFNYSKKFSNKIKQLDGFKSVEYEYDNTKVSLYVYHNKLNKKFVNEIIDLINFNIKLFNKIHTPRNNIKIYMLLTNFKKTININKSKQLIGDNINTGYTQSFSDSNEDYIVLYRAEEIKKVLVHELIHLYNFHLFRNPNSNKINNLIKSTNKRFSIFEAYTETFATIIYTYYYSKINNEDFNKLLNKQLLFSFIQSAKLLYNQKIDNIHDINNKIIEEDTNAVGYYILKCSILNNLNLYKNLFNENEGVSLNSNERVNKFDENLVKSIKNKHFKNNMNKFLLILKNNELKSITNSLLRTFRMNILD